MNHCYLEVLKAVLLTTALAGTTGCIRSSGAFPVAVLSVDYRLAIVSVKP
jgi:hypothetical protein